MSIIDVPRKSPWNSPMSMWQVFCTWEYTLGHFWHQPEKLYFEPSQIATVTYCDNSGILAIAICDLSQFVIKVETWHIESNNTENVFCVLGRVPMFIFDMNMKSCISAHFGVISLVYIFACISVIMSIIDVTRKTPWNGPKSMWTCFLSLVVYHRALLTSIWDVFWTVTKLRQSQIATLSSQFVICRNLWSRPWRGMLTPITLKTCYGYLGEYPCSLLTWIWKVSYLPILVLFHWFIFSYVYQL